MKEISGNVTKKLFKTLYRTVILITHIFKILAGKPVEKRIKKIKCFLLHPLKEIPGNVTKRWFKTLYRTVILSTHIFKILAGKPLEERIKKIKCFLLHPLKFQEMVLKNCLKLFTEQLYYQRIFSKSLQGSH